MSFGFCTTHTYLVFDKCMLNYDLKYQHNNYDLMTKTQYLSAVHVED